MITVVSFENTHLHGDILPAILRLRHHAFKERQSYDVPSYKQMEYDVYDNPATVYLAWRDTEGVVRGCSRLLPTSEPYMIEQIWPEIVNYNFPKSLDIWEASRFCIDRASPPHIRKVIHAELLCAFQEYGLANQIDWMIGVMTRPIWRCVFTNAGWPIEFLGPTLEMTSREKIIAGKMKISQKILNTLHLRHNIHSPVLQNHIYEDLRIKA